MSKYPQTITIWKQTGVDLRGNPSYTTPITTPCRYEKRTSIFINSEGRESRGVGVVYLPDDLASIGDFIFEGESTEAKPSAGSLQVRSYEEISNLSGNRVQFKIIL